MSSCKLTLFGRPLADMKQADANHARGWLADLDWCDDCTAFLTRQSLRAFDAGASRIAETDRHTALGP